MYQLMPSRSQLEVSGLNISQWQLCQYLANQTINNNGIEFDQFELARELVCAVNEVKPNLSFCVSKGYIVQNETRIDISPTFLIILDGQED